MVEIVAEAAPAEAPPPEEHSTGSEPAPQLQAVPTPPPAPAPEPEAPAPAAAAPAADDGERGGGLRARAGDRRLAGRPASNFIRRVHVAAGSASRSLCPSPHRSPEHEPATFAAEPSRNSSRSPNWCSPSSRLRSSSSEPVFVEAVESEPQQAPAWEARSAVLRRARPSAKPRSRRSNGRTGPHHYAAPRRISSVSYTPEAMSPPTLGGQRQGHAASDAAPMARREHGPGPHCGLARTSSGTIRLASSATEALSLG